MNDPEIDRILRDAKDDGDGRAVVFIVLLVFVGLVLAGIWWALGGKIS